MNGVRYLGDSVLSTEVILKEKEEEKEEAIIDLLVLPL